MSIDYSFIKKIFRTFFTNPHLTPKKFLNLVLAGFQYKFLRNPIVKTYPIRLIVDPANMCNLRCPLCPTGQLKPTRNKTVMDLTHYKHLVDEVSDYLFEIDLYNWGEPFLNPALFEMIEYAQKKNIRTTMSSNFNILNDTMARQLVKSGLEQLTLSIDGASPESYIQYRVRGNFERVIRNIKMLVKARKELHQKNPRITWQFLVMKHNEHEIEKARKMAQDLGVDEIFFRPIRPDMGAELHMSDEEKYENAKDWLPADEKYSRFDLKNKTKKKKYKLKSCLFLWTQASINSDGSVSPCCGVYDQKDDFGNAFLDGGFMKVWNNKTYQKARQIASRQVKPDNKLLCSKCVKNGFLEY